MKYLPRNTSADGQKPSRHEAALAFAFGLSLLAMVYTIGPISGCHINPAVTLGFPVAKRISAREAGGYILAQIAGAILGSAVVLMIAHGAPAGYSAHIDGLGANGYGMHSPSGYPAAAAFLMEPVLTFLFVLTVRAVFVGGWAIQQLWLFLLAPLAGGVLAALCYTALWGKGAPSAAPAPSRVK